MKREKTGNENVEILLCDILVKYASIYIKLTPKWSSAHSIGYMSSNTFHQRKPVLLRYLSVFEIFLWTAEKRSATFQFCSVGTPTLSICSVSCVRSTQHSSGVGRVNEKYSSYPIAWLPKDSGLSLFFPLINRWVSYSIIGSFKSSQNDGCKSLRCRRFVCDTL